MDPVTVMIALGILRPIAEAIANKIRNSQQFTAAEMTAINKLMHEVNQQWADLAPKPPTV